MIEIKNLNKYYNKNKHNEFHALKDINLSIQQGEMVAIMGSSGAGKSTLLHILGCVDDFDSGSVAINGTIIDNISDKQKAKLRSETIGIVLQDFGLIDEYTVLENVLIPVYFSSYRKNVKKHEALTILDSLGIKDTVKKNTNELSGGQKQRVAIARAMINNPKIILADEPTGALDSSTTIEILELLKQLNRTGVTIIIVTHDDKVAEICNRVITLSDGMNLNDIRTHMA